MAQAIRAYILILGAALALAGCGGGWVVPSDPDGDGWTAEEGDCDNLDPLTFPGAVERCDGKDNDCDGLSELDRDGDGVLACVGCAPGIACGDCDDADPDRHPGAPERCDGEDDDCDGQGDVDADHDGACLPEDCDDHDAWVFPGAPERCNGRDDDCDGSIEEPGQDADQDGWPVCAAGGGDGPDDCDDHDPKVHPFAPETCNGRDDDCDGVPDDPAGAFDHDGDSTSDCVDNDLDGLTERQGDCDDLNTHTWPGAPEYLDGRDNDCDGEIDEQLSEADDDGDGFSASSGDCDDHEDHTHPGAPEACDGVDQDCDHGVDEGLIQSWFKDGDGDHYGRGSAVRSCQPKGAGWATAGGDCDDAAPAVHPGAPEVCNGVDDNCDGRVDEWPDEAVTWYRDDDGDGYGLTDTALQSGCVGPQGYATLPGDCDDGEVRANPGHPEWCADGLDNDCDGTTDETASSARVRAPGPGLQTTEGEMNTWRVALAFAVMSSAPAIMGTEGCCDAQTFYYDADGDGYGDPGDTVQSCEQPMGYVDNGDDCDDLNPRTNPGAAEQCDGRDNNCDGITDEDCPDGEALCERTGGTWTAGCSPVTCENPWGDGGISCLVAVPICECPADAPYWDDDKGCISIDDCTVPVDQDGDGYSIQRGDCDDTNPRVNPGAAEICDGIDNDCDQRVDEDCPDDQRLCEASGGEWNTCGSLCDDQSCPGAATFAFPCTEQCAAVCDCPDEAPYWVDGKGCVTERQCPDYTDNDGDGYSEAQGDCDDSDPAINPRAQEVCDGLDNDCNGRIDDVDSVVLYLDNDLDGYGGAQITASACSDASDPAENVVRIGGDCNDRDPSINPAAAELCDGVDNNCDGNIDERCNQCYFDDAGTYWCPCDVATQRADVAIPAPAYCPCDPTTGECPTSETALCGDTGGRWNGCGSGCGPETCANPNPGDICPDVCVPQCECPADAPLWDDKLGCIKKDQCDPSAEERLCGATGGEWGEGCGQATCADPNAPLTTVCITTSPMCLCPLRAPFWDDSRGCIAPSDCRLGPAAQCLGSGGSWVQGCEMGNCADTYDLATDCDGDYWFCECTRAAPIWDVNKGCVAAGQCR